jgi:hypothetical protein
MATASSGMGAGRFGLGAAWLQVAQLVSVVSGGGWVRVTAEEKDIASFSPTKYAEECHPQMY